MKLGMGDPCAGHKNVIATLAEGLFWDETAVLVHAHAHLRTLIKIIAQANL